MRLRNLIVLSLVFFLAGCERPVGKDGKYAFFFDMNDTIPYDAFDPNPVTQDGLTLRQPVKGTIARGQLVR